MRTVKILLVSTLSGEGLGFVKHGLGIISACLKKQGHIAHILNDPKSIDKTITDFKPDIIGISGLSNSFEEMLVCAQVSHKINPTIPVFAGGVAATLSSEDFDNEPAKDLFDYVLCGEGEITFTNIINEYAATGTLPKERKIKGEIVYNLDELPFADRLGYENGEAKHPLFSKDSGRMFSMLNSRWCRKRCRFCAPASATIFGGVKKLRSVDNFIEEIKTFPKDALIMIHDDNMIENIEWAEEFVEKYRAFSYPFICQAYPAEIVRAEQLLKNLKEVGLVGLLVGFESGSNRMLRYMRKGTNREIILKSADILHKSDIGIQANLMFGCPTETPDEMMQTVDIFNKHIYPAIPSAAVYTPYPGSYWYEELKEQGLITIKNSNQYERYPDTSDKIQGVNYDAVRQAMAQLRQYQFAEEKKAATISTLNVSGEMPLVSICIPVYNGEKYIEEALTSAISQTYPHIEIIVSDNNSDDRTLEIAKFFLRRSSAKFLLLSHPQCGMAQNWNFCISYAKGKYIKFLFHDDLLVPTCIEEMVNLAEQDNGIGMVFSPRELLIEESADIIKENYRGAEDIHKYWSCLKPVQNGQELLNDPNLFNYSMNKIGEPSTVLIKKEAFEKVGLFDIEIPQLVDVEMWFRIMSQFKIGFINKVLSQFRIHSEQITHKNIKNNVMLFDSAIFFQKIYTNDAYPDRVRGEFFQKFKTLCEQHPELNKKIRQSLAKFWLRIPAEQLEKKYQAEPGNAFRMLMESNIRNEALTEGEQTFFQNLASELTKRSKESPATAINCLLAVMLYCPRGRMKVENAQGTLPAWLIGDYEKWFLEKSELTETESSCFPFANAWENSKKSVIKNETKDCLASVVVPWWDHSELIELWEDNMAYLSDAEVIFVDNGSADEAKVKIQNFCERHNHVKLIRNEKNKGFSAANNQGIKIARGEYIIHLNNDIKIFKNPVQYLCDLAGDGIAGPGPFYISDHFPDIKTEEFYIAGWALCIKKSDIEMLGGWCEEYGAGYWEDTDLCFNARLAGYTLTPIADIEDYIHHIGNVTAMGRIKGSELIRNKQIFINKYYDLFFSKDKILKHDHSTENSGDPLYISRLKQKVASYRQSPSEQGIAADLRQERRKIAETFLNTPREKIGDMYQTDIGEAYDLLLISGLQESPLGPEDESLLQKIRPAIQNSLTESVLTGAYGRLMEQNLPLAGNERSVITHILSVLQKRDDAPHLLQFVLAALLFIKVEVKKG